MKHGEEGCRGSLKYLGGGASRGRQGYKVYRCKKCGAEVFRKKRNRTVEPEKEEVEE